MMKEKRGFKAIKKILIIFIFLLGAGLLISSPFLLVVLFYGIGFFWMLLDIYGINSILEGAYSNFFYIVALYLLIISIGLLIAFLKRKFVIFFLVFSFAIFSPIFTGLILFFPMMDIDAMAEIGLHHDTKRAIKASKTNMTKAVNICNNVFEEDAGQKDECLMSLAEALVPEDPYLGRAYIACDNFRSSGFVDEEECIEKILEMHFELGRKCEDISKGWLKDKCYLTLDDFELCGKIHDKELFETCIRKEAAIRHDESMCTGLEVDHVRDDCFFNTLKNYPLEVMEERHKKLCIGIKDTKKQGMCIDIFYHRLAVKTRDLNYCYEIRNDTIFYAGFMSQKDTIRKRCILDLGISLKRDDLCNRLPPSDCWACITPNMCYFSVAVSTDDKGFCEKIAYEELVDSEKFDYMPEEVQKERLEKSLAYKQGIWNPARCEYNVEVMTPDIWDCEQFSEEHPWYEFCLLSRRYSPYETLHEREGLYDEIGFSTNYYTTFS
jgi:hypothetical protein